METKKSKQVKYENRAAQKNKNIDPDEFLFDKKKNSNNLFD